MSCCQAARGACSADGREDADLRLRDWPRLPWAAQYPSPGASPLTSGSKPATQPGLTARPGTLRSPPRRIKPYSPPATPVQGSELRDALLGRIFGYAAVARSGRPLPADLAASMADGLVAAAQKKSFLREAAGGSRAKAVLPYTTAYEGSG